MCWFAQWVTLLSARCKYKMVSRLFLFLPFPLHWGIQFARQTDICWWACKNFITVHCVWTALLLLFEIITSTAFVRIRERTSFLFLFFSLYSFSSLFSTFFGVNQISTVVLSLQPKHNFCIACSNLATHRLNYLGFFFGGGEGSDILQLWSPLLF